MDSGSTMQESKSACHMLVADPESRLAELTSVLRAFQEMRQISLWQEHWWRQCAICGDEIIPDSHFVPVFETRVENLNVKTIPNLVGHAHATCLPKERG